jgi:hypothetical protein
MKHLVGKNILKTVDFMGESVEIKKLSVSEVLKVQDLVRKSEKSKANDAQIDLLKSVIKIAVVGADQLTDEDFNTFPLGELNVLSESIMAYSGLGAQSEGN